MEVGSQEARDGRVPARCVPVNCRSISQKILLGVRRGRQV